MNACTYLPYLFYGIIYLMYIAVDKFGCAIYTGWIIEVRAEVNRW